MKYRCWCEWLNEFPSRIGSLGYDEAAGEILLHPERWLEDARHHAFAEGRKLPTVEELVPILVAIHSTPKEKARALITYLEERHE